MKTIEEIVKNKVEELDVEEMVREYVYEIVKNTIQESIKKQTKDYVELVIVNEFNEQMAKPLKTDDGWGKKESYDSFEDLFKTEFKKKLSDSWDIKNKINEIVKIKVSELYEKNKANVINNIANSLVEESKR